MIPLVVGLAGRHGASELSIRVLGNNLGYPSMGDGFKELPQAKHDLFRPCDVKWADLIVLARR